MSNHEPTQNTTTNSTATAHRKLYNKPRNHVDKSSHAKSINPLLPDDEQDPMSIALYNWFFIAPEQEERIVPIKQLLSKTFKAWALSSTVLYVFSLAWIVGETRFNLYSSRLLPIPVVLIFYTARNLLPRVQDNDVRNVLWNILAALAWILGLPYVVVCIIALLGVYAIGFNAAFLVVKSQV